MDWAHVQDLLSDCHDNLEVLNLHTELEEKCNGLAEIDKLADLVCETLHAMEQVKE